MKKLTPEVAARELIHAVRQLQVPQGVHSTIALNRLQQYLDANQDALTALQQEVAGLRQEFAALKAASTRGSVGP